MGVERSQFIFSVGTKLAYYINKRYYNNIHYVWCAPDFDNKKQAPTSNPLTIAKRWLSIVIGSDRHAVEITNNKAGILAGAKSQYEAGIISINQLDEIRQLVALADYKAFFPVLYVINTKNIVDRSIEVNMEERASDCSVEYKVYDLSDGDYQLIDFFSLFGEFVTLDVRKAGE